MSWFDDNFDRIVFGRRSRHASKPFKPAQSRMLGMDKRKEIKDTVDCPGCGRPAGKKCGTATGFPHVKRIQAYYEHIAGKSPKNQKGNKAMGIHTLHCQFVQLSSINSRSKVNVDFSKTYHYLTDDSSVRAGDYVTVMSPLWDAPAVCKVVDIDWNTRLTSAFKRIIGKIDLTEYHNWVADESIRIEAEKAAARIVETNKRLIAERQREIRAAMARRHRAVSDAVVAERLAADPEYAAMQAELEQISSWDPKSGVIVPIG